MYPRLFRTYFLYSCLLFQVVAFSYPISAIAATMDDAKSAIRVRDYDKAFKIYKQLAKKNDKQAQYQVAAMYKAGRGVKQSDKSAWYWFEKSAKQGYAKAQYQLGVCYEEGEGVAANKQQAERWYKAAARQNYRLAIQKLNNSNSGQATKNPDATLQQLLHRAALKDDVDELKRLLEKGAKVNAQDKFGKTALMIAVEQNHINSVKFLLSKKLRKKLKIITVIRCC